MDGYRTPRLHLRTWRAADREPFARLNADPEVMRHFPAPLERGESDALATRIEEHFAEHRFGPWAVEVPREQPFIGFVGLARVGFVAPFTPAVELLWRLDRAAWGRGYATEAAREVCRIAFEELGLADLVAFTVVGNQRSRAVMERLGMTRGDDFDHPLLEAGHPLRRHVLYRLSAPDPPAPGPIASPPAPRPAPRGP